jgi:hypothetical protein
MNKNTNTKKRPTHTIFQVIGDGEKARWIRVGAGWTNKDGKGLFLKFDAYPVVGHISVREITEQDDARKDTAQPQ